MNTKIKGKKANISSVVGCHFRSMDDFALVLYRLSSEAQRIANDVRNSEGIMCAASVLANELRERADRTGEGKEL